MVPSPAGLVTLDLCPCLPRLGFRARLSPRGFGAPTCQSFTSGDNHVCWRCFRRLRKDGKGVGLREENQAAVSPGGRTRGAARPGSHRHPAWVARCHRCCHCRCRCRCCSKSADTSLTCRKSADTGLDCLDVPCNCRKNEAGWKGFTVSQHAQPK